jgi:hypothetical protein
LKLETIKPAVHGARVQRFQCARDVLLVLDGKADVGTPTDTYRSSSGCTHLYARWPTALKQLLVPDPGRPLGSGEVTVERAAGTIRIVLGVDLQNDPAHFLPVGTFGLGVKDAHVGDGVLFVVDGKRGAIRGQVGNIWILSGGMVAPGATC